MMFPVHRFANSDHQHRLFMIDLWQVAMNAREKATRYRKIGWNRDAAFWSRFAIERIKSVKHWAQKGTFHA